MWSTLLENANGQELWLALFAADFVFTIGFASIWRYIRSLRRAGWGPRIDEVASHYLDLKNEVDEARYYVVLVDIDIGQFTAYCEKRQAPAILEFGTLEEARVFARDASIDPREQESFACVYRGRKEYLAIYHDGQER